MKEALNDGQQPDLNQANEAIAPEITQIEPADSEVTVELVVEVTFSNLMSSTECNCLKDATHEPESTFIKKIDGPELREKDFLTYWEKGKQPATDDCGDVCGIRGISINLMRNEDEIQKTLEVYKETLTIKPNGKTKYIMFSIKNGAGLYKHTPTEHSDNHHDFFKSDSFSIEKIDVKSAGPVM